MEPKNILSNARGTRDLAGAELVLRRRIMDAIREKFRAMDAIEMETPLVERKSVVDKMYGEEFDKLVYEIVNPKANGATKEILRYDQTVPLARYCATNGIKSLRRYQIGKVYRRDKPNASGGRAREFYQCDFDIVGDDQGSGVHDLEMIDLLARILNELVGKNSYKIKINHKQIPTGVLLKFGVPPEKMSTICSAIDKLDKCSWEEVCAEFEEKGVPGMVAMRFKEFIGVFNGLVSSEFGRATRVLGEYADDCVVGELARLYEMTGTLGLRDQIEFDASLVRGMDYYTGIIFEAVYHDQSTMPNTLAAGGRYDKMIGKLGSQGDVPAIGMSIGIERLARVVAPGASGGADGPAVFVATIGDGTEVLAERIRICSELRNRGIPTAMSNKANPKMRAQFGAVFDRNIRYMVVVGGDEIDQNRIKIKDVPEKTEMVFDRDEAIQFLADHC